MKPENGTVSDADLNPEIKTVKIGVRQLRKIKIYPLAFGDELEMTSLVTEALKAFYLKNESNDAVFVNFMLNLLKENLGKILSLVTDDDGDKLLKEITNSQAINIAETIWAVNFESLSKNVKSFSEKIKNVLPSEKQSLQSVKSTDTE